MAIIIDGNGRVYGLGDPVTENDAARRKFIHDVMVAPREMVTYTSSGTFEKGDYPGLVSVRVKCVGGGGGGCGSSATSSGEYSVGLGGSGAEYREGFWTVYELPTSVTCTVGAGGAAASAGSEGNNGGDTSFGSLMTAARGLGGNHILTTSLTDGWFTADGPIPSEGSGGDLSVSGDVCTYGGKVGNSSGPSRLLPSSGGSSFFGSGGAGQQNGSGRPGRGYGSGGGGSANNHNNSARTGSAGAPGIIIVELYGSIGAITPLDPETFGFNRLMQVNQSEYDSLDPDDDTVYLVVDE